MTLKALLYQDGQKGAAPIITESLNWKEWTAGYSTYTDKRDLHMQDTEFGCEKLERRLRYVVYLQRALYSKKGNKFANLIGSRMW